MVFHFILASFQRGFLMEIDSLKKEIIIMIGMSFSGKTYYVDMNLLPHYQLVSKVHVLKHLNLNNGLI
jgi:hypothetical protein